MGEPKTVGIIPDGNRRYARKYGISLSEAYRKGIEVAENAIKFVKEHTKVKYIYFYTLSLENLKKRSKTELHVLFSLLRRYLDRFLERPLDIEVHFGGELDLLPRELVERMKKIEKVTEGGTPRVGLLVAYSGVQEVIRAANKSKGEVSDYGDLRRYFYLPDFPDVDLMLRTSGEMRLSGFLPLQASYAELVFYPKLWPEMEEDDFRLVLEEFSRRERRFGQ